MSTLPQDPVVAVVIPAYNAARFVGDAIRSVLAQRFADVEVLVVDDCSSDATAQVVEALARNDPRVRLLRHAERGGAWVARNTALAAARGRYVAFLDSDDWWLEGKLAAQLQFMAERGAAISYTQYRFVAEDGAPLSGTIPTPVSLDYRGLLKNTALRTSSVIVDRRATGDFRMRRTYYDDLALWLELLKRGFVARGLQRDLMRYRVVRGSLSWNKLRSAWHVWEVYRDMERLALPRALWCLGHYVWNASRKYGRQHRGEADSARGENHGFESDRSSSGP